MRRKMNDLMAKRAGMLAEAEAAYKSGDHDAYTAKMRPSATSTVRSTK